MNTNEFTIAVVSGVIGSLLASLVIFVGSGARGITRRARQRAEERWSYEVAQWATRKIGVRQGLTNDYIFSTLKYLFLGNIFWAFPEVVAPIVWGSGSGERLFTAINVVGLGLGLIFFLLGLGRVLRYIRLRRTDDDSLAAAVRTKPRGATVEDKFS